MIQNILNDLDKLKNPEKARILQGFFKTGVGQYGEGDIFIGITVPELKSVAKKYFKETTLDEVSKLLSSKIHEERYMGLAIIKLKYEKTNSENEKDELFLYSLTKFKSINNWDLVDTFVPYVIGDYLKDKDKTLLYELSKSQNLWEKRISILATFAFLKEKQFEDLLNISENLLHDKHDLIHKAVGWMLREAGKRDENILLNFLEKYYKIMPRTMLRYSIEKLEKSKKEYFMKK